MIAFDIIFISLSANNTSLKKRFIYSSYKNNLTLYIPYNV